MEAPIWVQRSGQEASWLVHHVLRVEMGTVFGSMTWEVARDRKNVRRAVVAWKCIVVALKRVVL